MESIWRSLESTWLMLGEVEKVEDKDMLIGFGKWRSPVTWKRAISPTIRAEANKGDLKKEQKLRNTGST